MSHSVMTKLSVVTATTRFEDKQAHYQSAITKDVIQEEETTTGERFRLKTLEEHRYATRFQEKRVTPKTWRSALREAYKLIQSGDRVKLADALYLLLEIIWLDPRGCNLATMFLDTGSIYLAFDHLEDAAKAYRNSLRLDGSNWKARYNLGIATARSQDFVEATQQLKLALETCPDDIAVEIDTILKEINRIQYSKNLRAFNETKKARTFTTQYLESLHLVSGVPKSNDSVCLQEDHTVSHHNGLALTSSTPQLLDVSHEWQGSLAFLLHRLHAFARCRHLSVQDELLRLDPTRTGGLPIQAFDELVARITGTPLRVAEQNELTRMLGNDGSTIFRFLAPNAESILAFDEIQQEGACHTLLDWNLYRKRAKRSENSRAGGLWYWFEMRMAKWIEGVLSQQCPTILRDHTAGSLVKILSDRGWLTPMDFAWKGKRLPEPDNFPMFQLADRGIFIYECHRARNCIEEEASRTLQMFLRRLHVKAKWRKNALHLGMPQFCHEKIVDQTTYLEDVHARLTQDTLFDQQVARDVLQCIEDIVNDVIISNRHKQKTYEGEVRWQEVPVRTEQRRDWSGAN